MKVKLTEWVRFVLPGSPKDTMKEKMRELLRLSAARIIKQGALWRWCWCNEIICCQDHQWSLGGWRSKELDRLQAILPRNSMLVKSTEWVRKIHTCCEITNGLCKGEVDRVTLIICCHDNQGALWRWSWQKYLYYLQPKSPRGAMKLKLIRLAAARITSGSMEIRLAEWVRLSAARITKGLYEG